jgi:hypothetical protein
MPRMKPYTAIGIRRLKCIRCGKRAVHQWQICSDGNQYRPICLECDIEMNEMVLKWIGFPDWAEKMDKYRKTCYEEVT